MVNISREKCFNNQFVVDLCEDITKVSPITARFGKCVATDSGDYKYKCYQPGLPVYGNITFEGVCHAGTFTKIQSWVKACYDGAEIRKTITVGVRQHQQEGDIRTFNLIDCFPQAFDYVDIAAEGNSGVVIRWRLEVRVDRIEMK